ncbi:hypothetical protein Q9L58_010666, partial [Maublancomyces gigas]
TWIQPQSRIEEIDNEAHPPWHHNNLDIKIDTGSKSQAAYLHTIRTQDNSLNSNILKMYPEGSLLNGQGGSGVVAIRSGIITQQASYQLGPENEVFNL